MNALVTASLLVLSLLLGTLVACDSNPTPHPAMDAHSYDVAEAGPPNRGEEDDLTPEPGPGEDDPDNAATDGDPAAGFQGCDAMGADVDKDSVDAAADAAADGEVVPTDCGPSEVAPTPSSEDNVDRVE